VQGVQVQLEKHLEDKELMDLFQHSQQFHQQVVELEVSK
jgi:hypothetical protein